MSMDKVIEKKFWNHKRVIMMAGAAGVVTVMIVLLLSVRSGQLRTRRDHLTLAVVKEDLFLEYIPVMGAVIPQETLLLTAAEGGRIDQIFLEAGTQVKMGDPILRFSNTNLLLDIMYREAEFYRQSNSLRDTRLMLEQNTIQMQQQLTETDHQLNLAEKQYQRQKSLYDEQIVSRKDYEEAEANYLYYKTRKELTQASMDKDLSFRKEQIGQLEASLRRMEENLAIVKQKQAELTVTAPIAGLLSSLEAELGQAKAPGQTIGQIDVLGGFKVRAEIDEHYISRVETGKAGSLDYQGRPVSMQVTKVYPEVLAGRFRVDMQFMEGAPPEIRRGQTLHLKLELGTQEKALLLDRGAFYQTTGGNWAFVVGPDGRTAEKRPIKLGRQNPDYFEVFEGLKIGEQVVVSAYEAFGEAQSLILKDE
jgi:HlyD family secretion protein